MIGMENWHKLAEVYRSTRPFPENGMHFRYLWCSGRSAACLTVGYDTSGMYFKMTIPIYRIGHPTLYFPWSDIESSPSKYLFVERAELRFSQVPNRTLHLTKRTVL